MDAVWAMLIKDLCNFFYQIAFPWHAVATCTASYTNSRTCSTGLADECYSKQQTPVLPANMRCQSIKARFLMPASADSISLLRAS
eukprot:5271799-Amphidinium_carterae.1